MLILKFLAFVLVWSAAPVLFLAIFALIWTKRQLSPQERDAIRQFRGARGPLQAVLVLGCLVVGIVCVAIWGLTAAPWAMLPLILAAIVGEAMDIFTLLRSPDSLSPQSKRTLLLPSSLILIGVTLYLAAALAMLATYVQLG